jgi:hypothetical protein
LIASQFRICFVLFCYELPKSVRLNFTPCRTFQLPLINAETVPALIQMLSKANLPLIYFRLLTNEEMDTEVKVTELKKSEVLMKLSWERYCAFEDYAYEDKERVGVADFVRDSVADPDPNLDPDPHVFGSPGSGSFCHKANLVRKNLIFTLCVTSF